MKLHYLLYFIVLGIAVGKEPPKWHEAVYLREALLPNSATKLTASEDFISQVTRLAKEAEAHRASDTHAKNVHQNYRTALLGEHIAITPHSTPDLIELGETPMTVHSIIVGFRRESGKFTCEFNGLFIIDGNGLIHEYFKIPDKQVDSFEGNLKNWLTRRVEAVKAARARVKK